MGKWARRTPWGTAAGVAFTLFLLATPSVGALDISGRTDTGYEYDWGDWASLNRAYNYETLDVGIVPGLKFSMNGALYATLGDRIDSYDSTAMTEVSDNALRNLLDALNAPNGTWVEYSLYSAQLTYSAATWGLSVGRASPLGTSVAPYDGVSGWIEPVDWLHVEAFAGLPWQDANVAQFSNLGSNLSAGEFETGAKVSATFLGGALSSDLSYVVLNESTYSTATLDPSSSVVLTGYGSVDAGWSKDRAFGVGAQASFVNTRPLDFSLWSNGLCDPIHLAYKATVTVQPLDASAVADAFDAFAALLGASQAYASGSLDLTEDLSSLVFAGGLVKVIQVDGTCDYRQPLGTSGVWNPQYLQFRVGPYVGFAGGFSVSVYDNYLWALSSSDSGNTLGGELREKIKDFDFRLGTSFDASSFQADSSADEALETLNTMEYYLKAKWQATKDLDLRLNASYTTSTDASTVTTSPADPSVSPAMTTVSTILDDNARSYFRLDLRLGYRF